MRRAALVFVAAAIALAGGSDPVRSAFSSKAGPRADFAAAAVFAPRLLTPPGITGTAREGQRLTAVAATWARNPTSTTAKWFRCGAASCLEVGTGATHDLTNADAGHTIELRITATNAGGSATATSPRTATVLPLPPANQTAPTITGTPTVGEELTASPGTWTGSPQFSYRWLRCTGTACAPAEGPKLADHLVTGDDAGHTLRVEITATNAGGSATATSTPTAAVGRASFTQMLCRNPEDGTHVGVDGELPDGLTFGRNVTQFPSPAAQTRCATTNTGIPLSTGGTWSVSTGNLGGWLQYRGTAEVQFAGATLYRHGQMGASNFSWAVHKATASDVLFATPRSELCSWGGGCTQMGDPSTPFAQANRLPIAAHSLNGFNVVLLCDVPAGRTCNANGTQTLRIFGGKVSLRDTTTPTTTAPPVGSLAADASLSGTENLAFTATDTGSGLHRVRVRIDGDEVESRVLHDNGGRCRDVDPGDGDPFEFTHRQPCPTSLALDLDFDTSGWPKHGHLHVLLEDAGRNTTTLVSRDL